MMCALKFWKRKEAAEHDAHTDQHDDHALDHVRQSPSGPLRVVGDLATSLRCHQPPPSAWNNAAVSA